MGLQTQIITEIVFKDNNNTFVNIAKKYKVTPGYVSQINAKLKMLKYPPKLIDNKIACFKCDTISKDLQFHHNCNTGEFIALVCQECNRRIGKNELDFQIIEKKDDIKEEHTSIPRTFISPTIMFPDTIILYVTKLCQNKIWIPKRIQQRIDIKNDDSVMICSNRNGDIIIKKAMINSTTSDMFTY